MTDEKTPPNDETSLSDGPEDDVTAMSEPEAVDSPVVAETEAQVADDAEAQAGETVEDAAADPDNSAEELDDIVDDTDEDYLDDEYAADELTIDTSLDEDEDEIETSPVSPIDWTALAGAGENMGVADVPDLTLAGENPMDVDVDAALAAVDTLGAVVAAEQERKRDEADRREAQRRADEEYRKWAESYVFRRPGMIRVQSGRVVTILPAVALMAVGAVLTLATASGQAMSWQTLAAAASAGLSVSLLSYWLASGRWARGALFAALVVAAAGAWIFLGSTDIRLSWTLPFVALGAAFALTGLFGRPRAVPWVLAGVGVILGAIAVPFLSLRVLNSAAPFILVAAVVLALLPALFRVRRG